MDLQLSPPQRRTLVAALVAGQIAGLLFLGWLVLASATVIHPRDPLRPLQLIGAFFLGEAHLGRTDAAALLGLVVNQLGPALGWSLVFGGALLLGVPRRMGPLLVLGASLGLLAAFVDGYLLAPPIGGVLQGRNAWGRHLGWFWDWSAHLGYGLALGWFFAVLSPRLSRRRA